MGRGWQMVAAARANENGPKAEAKGPFVEGLAVIGFFGPAAIEPVGETDIVMVSRVEFVGVGLWHFVVGFGDWNIHRRVA